MTGVTMTRDATRSLARFLSGLRPEHVPEEVVERAKDLFLDWVGSALAGKAAAPVEALEDVALQMGPAHGPSEVLVVARRFRSGCGCRWRSGSVRLTLER